MYPPVENLTTRTTIMQNVINQSSLAWIHQNPLFQNNPHRLLQLYNPIRNLSIWGPIHEEFPLGPKRVCSHCQLFWWDIHKWSHQFFSGRVNFFENYGSLLLYLYSLINEYPFIAFKKTKFLAVELFSIFVSVSFCMFETDPFIRDLWVH